MATEQISITPAEIIGIPDSRLYSTKDLSQATGITNRSQLNHEMKFAMRSHEDIVPRNNLQREKGRKILFNEIDFGKLVYLINSKREPILIPESNKPVEVTGEMRRKTLRQLLEAYKQDKPVPMHELLSNYAEDADSPIEKKRYRVLRILGELKQILKDYEWTIVNARIHGHGFQGKESLYSLKPCSISSDQIEISASSEKNEVAVIEFKDVESEFDPTIYVTPKGEKPFYSLADIARDLGPGVDKSDVRRALSKKGIEDFKSNSSQGGRKEEMRLSYFQYQMEKDYLQQEVKRKKKPKREPTSSPVTVFQEVPGHF